MIDVHGGAQVALEARDLNEVYPVSGPQPVVYLSPDSPNVLSEVRLDTVYVVGALVDRTIKKV